VRNGRLAWIGWLARSRWFARTGRLARLARQMGLGRNPLRRRTDRIEAWICAALLVVFLIGAPLFASGLGNWVHQGGMAEQRAQQSWHQTPATLVTAAPRLPMYAFRLSWQSTVPAQAQWLGPAGQALSGEVPAPAGTRAGQTVQIWVDGSGRVTGAPLGSAELTRRVISAEVVAPAALAVLLLCLAGVARWLLNRRRLAAWETAWASIGPRWSRHRK
jgi:hypothetical protein